MEEIMDRKKVVERTDGFAEGETTEISPAEAGQARYRDVEFANPH
jgi:hypothetical protein